MSDFRTFFQHHLTTKLASLLAFLAANYSQWRFTHDDGHSVDTADFTNAFGVPWHFVCFFFFIQLVFQFFYLLQHHSRDASVAESAGKTTWNYFFWALWFSLWSFFFLRHNFWVAFVFSILTVVTLGHSSCFTKTHFITPNSRWWFIHFAFSSLTTAFAHWAFFFTLWSAIGWDNSASDIVADVCVWWFFLYPAFHLNRFGDWGHGLTFSYFAWGLWEGNAGNTLQHWFTLAIAILDTIYTFVVGYPDIPSESVESGHRHGEHAPLLSGEA